ncbi:hypothetical protein RND81_05G017200 [Saponaria officinalis]|uniref:Uncharacterized protein n=1 Tax=Saponaria officinalis TaxID=3572 RepID=A0AAW1KQ85_SAPOF
MAKKMFAFINCVLLLLVIFLCPCHARLLNGGALSNKDVVDVANVATLGQNRDSSTQIFKIPSSKLDDDEDINGGKYKKFRSLVLNALPKGTKQSSGSSKRHNDVNT